MLQRTQDLRQWAGAQLRASAGTGRERREADLFAREHSVSLGNESGQRARTADGRVPHADREHDEQCGEREVLDRSSTADDHEEQQHGCARDESEVEYKKKPERTQMTLCSLMRSPRRNRSYASGVTSRDVRPSTINSAIASPVAGACMMP